MKVHPLARLAAMTVTLSGCAYGFGTPYPDAPGRVQHGCVTAGGGSSRCVAITTEQNGEAGRGSGGMSERWRFGRPALGGLVGLRLGGGPMHLGGRDDQTAVAVEGRAQGMLSLSQALGIGLSTGYTRAWAKWSDVDLTTSMVPVSVSLALAPIDPLFFEFGAGGAYVMHEADARNARGDSAGNPVSSSGLGGQLFAGAGISMAWPGLALRIAVEYRVTYAPAVQLPNGGSESLSLGAGMVEYTLSF